MKRVKCCIVCRRRHRKCVVQPGASQCGTCHESGQECRFENDIQFKHGHPKIGRESGREWRKVPTKISFTTPRGIDGMELEEPETETTSTADTDVANQSAAQPVSENMMEVLMDDLVQSQQEVASLNQQSPSNHWKSPSNHWESPSTHWESPSNSMTSPPVYSPNGSSDYTLVQTLPAQLHAQSPRDLTEREAFLFMTYIYRLAPLSDACDDSRHFELEVPRLALHQPMIMNGLLALASLYDASDNVESTFYHNKCIKLLIEAFDQPVETWDSTLLTAVVIARLYEENDNETDSYYHHLSGTQNLLNHEVIARFVMQGGLAEAASWVHLRQVIYIYVVRRRPIQICLENFERSTVFRRFDDSAYANRAVYNFAKIMMMFLSTDSPEDDQGEFRAAGIEVDQWYDAKPVSFKPVFYNAADVSGGRPFPTLYFVASVPVIAMQYYYASKAVLYLRQCNDPQQKDSTGKQDLEAKISFYLCMLMGLALSNAHVVNAFYLPAHMLSLCGYCISDLCEQMHAIGYLEKVEEAIKWKTKTLIATLKTEWGN